MIIMVLTVMGVVMCEHGINAYEFVGVMLSHFTVAHYYLSRYSLDLVGGRMHSGWFE